MGHYYAYRLCRLCPITACHCISFSNKHLYLQMIFCDCQRPFTYDFPMTPSLTDYFQNKHTSNDGSFSHSTLQVCYVVSGDPPFIEIVPFKTPFKNLVSHQKIQKNESQKRGDGSELKPQTTDSSICLIFTIKLYG